MNCEKYDGWYPDYRSIVVVKPIKGVDYWTDKDKKEIVDEIADKLPEAINTALEQAKESGEFDGDPGISPHIGDNGNWFVGNTDTGVQAQGDDYVLTDADMSEIAQLVINLLPKYNGEVENV